ncbi:chemotaxis protein CheW [Paludibaculum fermentans]|uniref:chemotaxis protein CheW n=1 Tax=Paludibaculum fermentans TaxID=1473598 RepID=UPI003EBC93F4
MAGGEQFLVVRLAGHEYAIPSGRVCGMVQTRGVELHRVDGRGALRYVTSLHGRTVPIYVPNRVLGLAEQDISARSCLLLIREVQAEEESGQEADFALAVDSVSRLAVLPPAAVRAGQGLVRLGDKWRTVLDLEALRAA